MLIENHSLLNNTIFNCVVYKYNHIIYTLIKYLYLIFCFVFVKSILDTYNTIINRKCNFFFYWLLTEKNYFVVYSENVGFQLSRNDKYFTERIFFFNIHCAYIPKFLYIFHYVRIYTFTLYLSKYFSEYFMKQIKYV